MNKETYRDYNGNKISKEKFLNLRDDDIRLFGFALISSGEDYIELLSPRDIKIIKGE